MNRFQCRHGFAAGTCLAPACEYHPSVSKRRNLQQVAGHCKWCKVELTHREFMAGRLFCTDAHGRRWRNRERIAQIVRGDRQAATIKRGLKYEERLGVLLRLIGDEMDRPGVVPSKFGPALGVSRDQIGEDAAELEARSLVAFAGYTETSRMISVTDEGLKVLEHIDGQLAAL